MSKITKTQVQAEDVHEEILDQSTASICLCGCGQPIEVDARYRQGHDAKHVSILLSYVEANLITRDQALGSLASTPLKVKFTNALARRQRAANLKAERAALREANRRERAAAKSARKPRKAEVAAEAEANPTAYEVKVGRWWYPVTELGRDGDRFFVAYTTKDGSTKEARVDFDKVREVRKGI